MLKSQSPIIPQRRSPNKMLATLAEFKQVQQQYGQFRITYLTTCPFCHNRFDYAKRELKEEVIPLAKGEQLIRTYVVCPDCKERIVFSSVKRSTIKL